MESRPVLEAPQRVAGVRPEDPVEHGGVVRREVAGGGRRGPRDDVVLRMRLGAPRRDRTDHLARHGWSGEH